MKQMKLGEVGLIMQPGEIYETISDIYGRSEVSLKVQLGLLEPVGVFGQGGESPCKIARKTVFLFIEEINLANNTYSKILVDEEIYLTYNAYHLNGTVKKIS